MERKDQCLNLNNKNELNCELDIKTKVRVSYQGDVILKREEEKEQDG